MTDPALGLTVVFNGCIYNHARLREELEGAGYRFFSNSDTEVLLKAYHRWGEAFVDRLAGMFAFCIVERDSGRAVLGRDRLGIKPLYLAEGPGRLRFASTLPALVAARPRPYGPVLPAAGPGRGGRTCARAAARAPRCAYGARRRRRRVHGHVVAQPPRVARRRLGRGRAVCSRLVRDEDTARTRHARRRVPE